MNLAGKDRNMLLKYITKTVNKNGSGEDLYKCDICGKEGARKDNVHNHVENIHFPGTFEYKCHICSKSTPTKKALNNHIHRNHKEGEPEIVLQTKFAD
jgi:DNA-directed RNA polymerase subunit RPC12/RpoP